MKMGDACIRGGEGGEGSLQVAPNLKRGRLLLETQLLLLYQQVYT